MYENMKDFSAPHGRRLVKTCVSPCDEVSAWRRWWLNTAAPGECRCRWVGDTNASNVSNQCPFYEWRGREIEGPISLLPPTLRGILPSLSASKPGASCIKRSGRASRAPPRGKSAARATTMPWESSSGLKKAIF